jgi:signal peptidase I
MGCRAALFLRGVGKQVTQIELGMMSRFLRLGVTLVILVGVSIGCTSFLPIFDSPLVSPLDLPENIEWYRMESVSMLPTLQEGDYIGVDRSAYLNRTPGRGDLIIFAKKDQPDLIKRVVGLPGETIEVRDGKVLINETAIDEPYVAHGPNYQMDAIVIETDHVFVLGDNRPNSSDSHVWGTVPYNDIVGQVILVRTNKQ